MIGNGTATRDRFSCGLLLGLMILLQGCSSGPPVDTAPIETNAEVSMLRSELAAVNARLGRLEAADRNEPVQPDTSPLPVNLLNRSIDVSDLPGKGAPAAPVAIIEVTDYQCPYCRAHYREALAAIEEQLIEPGLVRYFIYDYPLPGHHLAPLAAVAAGCAARQGHFWPFHDALFELPSLQDEADIIRIAGSLSLDMQNFDVCRQEEAGYARLEVMASLALGLGIRGTPGFFIGRLGNDGRVRELTLLQGLQGIDEFASRVARYSDR